MYRNSQSRSLDLDQDFTDSYRPQNGGLLEERPKYAIVKDNQGTIVDICNMGYKVKDTGVVAVFESLLLDPENKGVYAHPRQYVEVEDKSPFPSKMSSIDDYVQKVSEEELKSNPALNERIFLFNNSTQNH